MLTYITVNNLTLLIKFYVLLNWLSEDLGKDALNDLVMYTFI